MPLLINNDICSRVLTMRDALDVMENAFRQLGNGQATFQPRTDIWSPTAKDGDFYRWGSLLGAIREPPTLALRFKSDIIVWEDYREAQTEDWFCVERGKYCGFIILIDTSDGAIIALMNDGMIQHVRVGATAGIGAKYLSRADSEVVGMLGSGGMARSYAEAFCAVRPIRRIQVYSPTPKNRHAYADDMSRLLGISVVAVERPEDAMKDADIVATCTDSRVAVYRSEFLKLNRPGTFLVGVAPQEMDSETYAAIDKLVVTTNAPFHDFILGSDRERGRRPSDNDYRRKYTASNYETLPDVIAGRVSQRRHNRETVFFRNGSSGIQFAAVGRLVYEKAKERRLGTPLPLDWFLQDIKN